MRAIQARNERFLCLRVAICGRPERVGGSCYHASAQRSPYSVPAWCLRNRLERRFVRPGDQGFPGWWGCASSPTSRTTPRDGPPRTTCANGATSGNGATRRTSVPCCSPATAAGHGTASSAAYCRTSARGRTARSRAATRDPPTRHPSWRGCAAAASGHGRASRAGDRRTVAPGPIARCGRAALATGADRNARAAA
jgi:hypothetical protein